MSTKTDQSRNVPDKAEDNYYKQIREELAKIWSSQPLHFDHWQFYKQVEIDELLDKLPEKLGEKPVGTEEPEKKEKRAAANPKVEPTETAKILNLTSGDNEKARILDEYCRKKMQRTLNYVSTFHFDKLKSV